MKQNFKEEKNLITPIQTGNYKNKETVPQKIINIL